MVALLPTLEHGSETETGECGQQLLGTSRDTVAINVITYLPPAIKRRGNIFGRVCTCTYLRMHVCRLFMYVCNTITFESHDVEIRVWSSDTS